MPPQKELKIGHETFFQFGYNAMKCEQYLKEKIIKELCAEPTEMHLQNAVNFFHIPLKIS